MKMDEKYPLLPHDEEISDWQWCIKKAIIDIHAKAMPYKRGTWGGSTEDIYYDKRRILRKGEGTYCVGCTSEIFFRAWKEFTGDYLETPEGNFTGKEAWEVARAFFFAYKDEEIDGMRTDEFGAMGWFKWLANRPERFDWIETFTTHNPYEIQFGDWVSMQFAEDYSSGHATVGLGLDKYKGNDVVNVYSSTTYYDKTWMKEKGVENPYSTGNGFDYYRLNVTKNGFKRKFFVSRLVQK